MTEMRSLPGMGSIVESLRTSARNSAPVAAAVTTTLAKSPVATAVGEQIAVGYVRRQAARLTAQDKFAGRVLGMAVSARDAVRSFEALGGAPLVGEISRAVRETTVMKR